MPPAPWVVNPTLTAAAWVQNGKVTGDAGGFVLGEARAVQTQLAQAFQVGSQDRFLRFTVQDGNLKLNGANNGAGGPQDAFEVALLDAVTGQSLFGIIDTTRTDALINTQRDAAGALLERTSSNPALQILRNADGSTTYTIDLRSLLTMRSSRSSCRPSNNSIRLPFTDQSTR